MQIDWNSPPWKAMENLPFLLKYKCSLSWQVTHGAYQRSFLLESSLDVISDICQVVQFHHQLTIYATVAPKILSPTSVPAVLVCVSTL